MAALRLRLGATLLVMLLAATAASALTAAPAFTLDLDLPPEQRWAGAVSLLIERFGYDASFGPIIANTKDILSELTPAQQTTLLGNFRRLWPEYHSEMVGIQQALAAHGHPQPDAFLLRFTYLSELSHLGAGNTTMTAAKDATLVEVTDAAAHARAVACDGQHRASISSNGFFARACTGILAKPTSPATSQALHHGRNMDWAPPTGANLTLNVTVVRTVLDASAPGGRRRAVVSRWFDWAWICAGATATGVSVGGFTWEINEKSMFVPRAWGLARLLNTSVTSPNSSYAVLPMALTGRVAFDRGYGFDAAVAFASGDTAALRRATNDASVLAASLLSPAFFIMSGPGRRGVVLSVTVDPVTAVRATVINDTTPTAFLVQTNYDHWLPDPPNDPRRTVAEAALTALGPNLAGSPVGVSLALSTYPVHNPNTFYSALMSVEEGLVLGIKRQRMVPAPALPPHP